MEMMELIKTTQLLSLKNVSLAAGREEIKEKLSKKNTNILSSERMLKDKQNLNKKVLLKLNWNGGRLLAFKGDDRDDLLTVYNRLYGKIIFGKTNEKSNSKNSKKFAEK